MATNYLPLDEAAQRLGISHEKLVELRSQGEIRGFRDGASWKFPEAEIERVAADLESGDLDAGLSDLISESEVGSAIRSGKSSIIGGDAKPGEGSGSDVGVGDEGRTSPASGGSDVNLVSSGSDVKVVAGDGEDSDALQIADSGELTLQSSEDSGLGLIDLADEVKDGSTSPNLGKDLADAKAKQGRKKLESDYSLEADPMEEHDSSMDMLGEDLDLGLAEEPSAPAASGSDAFDLDDEDALSELNLLGTGGSDASDSLIKGDSDPSVLGGAGSDVGGGSGLDGSGLDFDDALDDDDDLVISADDDDDLVLGGAGSDISIAGDSGINLMSPSDSGLSLESEPLDLAGSSISALDLGAELEGSGSSPSGGSSGSGSGSGSGSLVDFQEDEGFQLSPSGVDIEGDDDSGSQVIEVEDSATFGSGVNLAGEGFAAIDDGGDPFADEVVADEDDAMAIDDDAHEIGVDPHAEPQTSVVAVRPTYEVPYSTLSVVSLLGILLLMSVGGMLVTDLMRNLWSYQEMSSPVSSLTDALIDMFGLGP